MKALELEKRWVLVTGASSGLGREMARGLTGGIPVYVWSALYADGAVYASDMPNGLWKLSPVTR